MKDGPDSKLLFIRFGKIKGTGLEKHIVDACIQY